MWSFYTLAEDSVKTQTAICINICEVHRTWLIRLLAQGQRPPVNTLWVGKCHFCSWFRTLSSWKPHLLGYALTHTQARMHTHTQLYAYIHNLEKFWLSVEAVGQRDILWAFILFRTFELFIISIRSKLGKWMWAIPGRQNASHRSLEPPACDRTC